METRFATTADCAALAALMAELGYPTSPEQMASRLATIAPRDDYVAFVATDGGAVAGMIGLSISPAFYRDDPGGAIVALVVSADFRGRGVAALLVERGEQWFAERGVDRISINPSNHRTPAHGLYRRSATNIRACASPRRCRDKMVFPLGKALSSPDWPSAGLD